ncbi:hypothetical protein BJ742DRAFT_815616 [Cladochytrium replicatum]|nr:hypothetical protein BJ742DRAFT_815616 [Cladochytrium replicatum]
MANQNDRDSSQTSSELTPSARNSLVHLPGAYPSQTVPSLEKLPDEDLFNHATWNILERFSRVTQLYRSTAGKLLEQSPIRPLFPPYLLSPDTSAQSTAPPPLSPDEFEPARVYLAQWAHDLQVSRGLESATNTADEESSTSEPIPPASQHIETRVEESIVPDLTLSSPSASTPLLPIAESATMTWSVVSNGVASTTKEKPKKVISQLQYLRNRKKKQKRGAVDDSEDDQVGWDETVEAETELGMFEVLSVSPK